MSPRNASLLAAALAVACALAYAVVRAWRASRPASCVVAGPVDARGVSLRADARGVVWAPWPVGIVGVRGDDVVWVDGGRLLRTDRTGGDAVVLATLGDDAREPAMNA